MRPMMPIVVSVFGPGQGVPGVLRDLERKLQRRGLHVQILRKTNDPLVPDSDILLVRFPKTRKENLSRFIEQLWFRRWVRWYKEVRHA